MASLTEAASGKSEETAQKDGVVAAAGAPLSGKADAKARAKRPRIDLDDSIAQARAAMTKAMKDVQEARRVARNERRKKQRLVKKAGILSAEDLERIAVLKRCGFGPLSSGTSTAAGSSAASSSGDGSAPPSVATSPLSACAAEPAVPALPGEENSIEDNSADEANRS